jgi:monoamine oxidase
MRPGGPSGAGNAVRRAQAVTRQARSNGMSVLEADQMLAGRFSRRNLLGYGAAVAVALPTLNSRGTASAATTLRSEPRIVVVGAGISGLGCAYRLWTQYGRHADVYEYNSTPGGRIRTLRNSFADGQLIEEHAEFINPEHTTTLALAKGFGLTLDNTDAYPPGTHPNREQLSFYGQPWSQAALNQDWHDWAWELFHQAAFETAPWPQLYNRHTPGGQKFDRMSVSEWIETYIPGGLSSDFGALCVSAVLDEFGGDPDLQSALNLVYLLGQDATKQSGAQPKDRPALGGANEKWHIHGGNDQLIYGILDRLPSGVLHLEQRLVAVRASGSGFKCTFECGPSTHDVLADHVVLALPFTTLRQVDLEGVSINPLHLQAIEQEPLGTNSKFFLQFDERVWNDSDRATGNCYCDGVVQGGWDATDYQPGTAGILVALPGGQSAQNWGSTYGLSNYVGQPPPAMIDAFLSEFNTLFPGVNAAFNGQSYFVWSPGDPHILGAYSYLKVGQYTAFNGIQGQREANLHFAGEHTSVNFQGYIEGGLRSGYRCADEIAT